MPTETFSFCPGRYVPETLPPEVQQGMSLNGWDFNSKPVVPYRRKFKLTMFGLRWYLNEATGLYDAATNANFNAKKLEEFYQAHQTWRPFNWTHQHIGEEMLVRFAAPVIVPAAPPNSGGWLESVEVVLIHHNPGYA